MTPESEPRLRAESACAAVALKISVSVLLSLAPSEFKILVAILLTCEASAEKLPGVKMLVAAKISRAVLPKSLPPMVLVSAPLRLSKLPKVVPSCPVMSRAPKISAAAEPMPSSLVNVLATPVSEAAFLSALLKLLVWSRLLKANSCAAIVEISVLSCS